LLKRIGSSLLERRSTMITTVALDAAGIAPEDCPPQLCPALTSELDFDGCRLCCEALDRAWCILHLGVDVYYDGNEASDEDIPF
jgi:hypothetical protein